MVTGQECFGSKLDEMMAPKEPVAEQPVPMQVSEEQGAVANETQKDKVTEGKQVNDLNVPQEVAMECDVANEIEIKNEMKKQHSTVVDANEKRVLLGILTSTEANSSNGSQLAEVSKSNLMQVESNNFNEL